MYNLTVRFIHDRFMVFAFYAGPRPYSGGSKLARFFWGFFQAEVLEQFFSQAPGLLQ